MDGIRTPQEIEEGIKSTRTVAWDPFTVLPKEICLEIFKKLDSPTDKQNFMNAHVRFYDLLKTERVKCLFGKVIKDLALDEKTWSKWEKTWEKKTDKNLISLRLICRDWDEAIKDYYQLHPDHFKFVFCEDKWANDSNHLTEQYANGYHIMWDSEWDGEGGWAWRSAKRDLGTDLGQFQASHPPSKKKNPFLTRKICIELSSPSNLREDEQLGTLWSQIDTLLETYGEHIWHFAYRSGWGLGPEMYERILQWLRLMPELRTLKMEFGYGTCTACYYQPTVFNRILQMDSPRMKKLQDIHVWGFSYFVFNKLLEGVEVLEKVEVGFTELKGFQFPTSLTELALLVYRYEEIKYLKTLEQFPLLRNLIIKLGLTDESDFNYSAIWNTIEEKFPALEDLQLALPLAYRYKSIKQSLDCRLNLRKLERLSITLPDYCCLDFLQEIKTLQEMNIDLIFSNGDEKDLLRRKSTRRERIQFNRDLTTMWESNIWQVFPNLRKLSIRDPGGGRSVEHLYKKGAKGQQIYNKILK